MQIVLLGPPGTSTLALAGKIASNCQLSLVNPNDALDQVAAENSDLGHIAKEAREHGRSSDELTFAALRHQWSGLKHPAGYVLHDLPQNENQIELLRNLLAEESRAVDLVFNLQVDNDALVERQVGYIQCTHCGAEYNLYTNPPLVDRVCDECGGRLKQRPADYEETISNRLRLYDIQMAPVLAHYDAEKILTQIPDQGDDLATLWKITQEHIKAHQAAHS
ncbi:MAG: nucleoside monophosphate kinase [Pseudomonadota bacterium]